MASVTLSVSDGFRQQLKSFSWVNWSEVAREEIMKKIIFEKYIKTGKISAIDWKFCEEKDWHPADELPLKKEFFRKLSEIRRQKSINAASVSEVFR